MEKESIDWTPFIIQGILFSIALVKIYVDIRLKLKEIEIRLQSVEKKDDTLERDMKTLIQKVNDIQVMLSEKADRD